MRERGDLQVLHEPFMYDYYIGGDRDKFTGFAPEAGHPTTYDGIKAMIREQAATAPVFLKDMAYYVVDRLPHDTDFAGQMTHAFLLRDPTEAALSYAKRDPDFSRTELGHEAQHRLYHALVSLGQTPVVITADQLRADPEATLGRYWAQVGLNFSAHAFTWDDRVPDGWQSVKGWHGEVLQSGMIRKPEPSDTAARLAELDADFSDYVAHHMPFYTELRDIAEAQAHQK